MRTITVDCSKVSTEKEFWDAYIAAALPEGREYFGCNLDAFWDAVSAGGPGWPGEDCELKFVNTPTVRGFRGGEFYVALMRIANNSKYVSIHLE
jgi:RNAse (barnase) inhibitor barstar